MLRAPVTSALLLGFATCSLSTPTAQATLNEQSKATGKHLSKQFLALTNYNLNTAKQQLTTNYTSFMTKTCMPGGIAPRYPLYIPFEQEQIEWQNDGINLKLTVNDPVCTFRVDIDNGWGETDKVCPKGTRKSYGKSPIAWKGWEWHQSCALEQNGSIAKTWSKSFPLASISAKTEAEMRATQQAEESENNKKEQKRLDDTAPFNQSMHP